MENKNKMNPEAQRIAIAEACGYKRLTQHEAVWSHKGSKIYTAGNLPNYLADLNAMRDAEMVLAPDQITDYLEWLGMCSGDDAHQVWAYVHATAAQRAEAFLRTIGKWEGAK